MMLNKIENLIPLSYRIRILKKVFSIALPYWRRINRNCDPRKWSNDELKRLSPHFTGDVINIAGGKDSDKENKLYKHYFINVDSYTVANYPKQYSEKCQENDLFLDLSVSLGNNSNFLEGYDVVFTHTVLEHIFDIDTALLTYAKSLRILLLKSSRLFRHFIKKKRITMIIGV